MPWLELADLRLISRADYKRMFDAGIFEEDERIELLRGLLVVMRDGEVLQPTQLPGVSLAIADVPR